MMFFDGYENLMGVSVTGQKGAVFCKILELR